MIVIVRDGAVELFKYDTVEINDILTPARADFDDIKQALRDALQFLNDDVDD
jgi:hypothetical protein